MGAMFVASKSYGQANPFINVLPSNSGIVSVGATIDVIVTIGNTGPVSTVPQAKLRPIIQIPASVVFLPTAQQLGLPAGWTILSNSGTQIRICNSTDPIAVNTSRTIILKAQGVTVSAPQTFSGNINFGNGTTCAAGTSVAGDLTTDNSALSTIEVVAPAGSVTATGINNPCNGLQAGQINATQTGLTGTITWSLNPVAGINNNDGTFEGLAAGTYTVTASNGTASATSTVVLTDPAVLANTMSSVSPLCNNGTDGSITITTTGGTPYSGAPGPYLVELWQGTPASGTQLNVGASSGVTTFSSLASGAYFVLVEDSTACLDTIYNITLANPAAITFAATATQISCDGGTGSATLLATGGTGAFTYKQGSTTVTSPVTGLAPGSYTFTATDANGCSTTASITIDAAPPALTVSLSATAPLCAGGNGVITATPAGGTPLSTGTFPNNYYYGATGTSTVNVFNQPAGTYPITVRDANGCSTTANVTVPATAPITNTVNVTQFGSYVIPGTTTTVTATGVYTQVYPAANTCDSTVTYNVTINLGVLVCAKAYLSGPYNTGNGLMRDSLRQKGLLPLNTPYGSGAYAVGYTTVNNTSTEVIAPGVLAISGNNAIVDWVFLQLRSKTDSSIVVATRSALVQCDGDVVDMDGTSPVLFATTLDDNYYVSIKHRNHIGVMASNKFALSQTLNCIDFTATATPLFVRTGTGATTNPSPLSGPTRTQNAVRTLYAGNCNISTVATSRFITYNSTNTSDRQALFTATGGTNTVNGYTVHDVDMNGYARFNGLNPDRLVILINTAGSNIIVTYEQTPN
jgi:hypothetical protein